MVAHDLMMQYGLKGIHEGFTEERLNGIAFMASLMRIQLCHDENNAEVTKGE